MQPGQKIEIQLVDELGNPVKIAGVIPFVRLFCRGYGERPRYTLQAWPTNTEGRSEVSFSDLEEERLVLGISDLMDFNTLITDCERTVEIWIPSESDFEERRRHLLERVSRWRPAWLTTWPTNGRLVPVQPKRVTLEGRVTSIPIAVKMFNEAP
jgi:hypothetical protein